MMAMFGGNSAKAAIVHFAETMLRLYPPYRWDEDHERTWIQTLNRELGGFSKEVIERAEKDIVRTRRKKDTPLVADCIEACFDAREALEAQKRAETLPALGKNDSGCDKYGEGRRELVDGTLLKTALAKQAAREGWIGLLEPYCFEHGRLPDDPAEIARMKRAAEDNDKWSGDGNPSDPVIAKARLVILGKREHLRRKVLGN